jgi:RNA polymerase sigma-70 factor, ECF subfamily
MEDSKQAFLKAYDLHADTLFRHCLFKVSDRELAKDLLQETFVKVWTYVAKGKEIDNMRAFLYKTLNNLVIDEYRKKKNFSLDLLAEDGFDPVAGNLPNTFDMIDGERAIKLLAKLDDPYKDAVFLRYVNGLEISEIVEITGQTENAVSVHIHRGLKKLKELYEGQ